MGEPLDSQGCDRRADAIISKYMIQGFTGQQEQYDYHSDHSLSTASLLEQAYSQTAGMVKTNTRAASSSLISRVTTAGKLVKPVVPRLPKEILKQLS